MRSKRRIFIDLINNRVISLSFIIVVMCVLSGIAFGEKFVSMGNLKAVVLNMSNEAIVAIGMMILLISGVFDLSVGPVYALSGSVAGVMIMNLGVNVWISVVVAILFCALVGFINGIVIARIGVNPMITTLAMMQIVRGADRLLAGSGIANLPQNFLKIADMDFLGFRISIWYMIIIAIVFGVLVAKTKFFRRYYYIGGNEKAAHLTGINVKKMRIVSFVISATLAGIAGLILTSRLTAATAEAGNGLEMRAITAAILGGASLMGGQGSILGVILGTLFMRILNNIMIIGRIPVEWQGILIGIILLLAVSLDVILNKRSNK